MKKKLNLPILLIISIILGLIIGLIFKDKIMFLKPIGNIYLNLMYTIVVPLVLFTLTSAIANMSSLKRLSKILKNVLLIFIITSLISAIFMIITLKIVNPVSSSIELEQGVVENIDIASKIVDMFTVSDFNLLFSKSNILPLIIFSILLGIAISRVGDNNIKNTIEKLSKITLEMTNIIITLAPIGLFAYFAVLANELGTLILIDYMKSFIIYFISSILYFLILYTLYLYIAGRGKLVKKFYKNIIPSVLTSFATQSSLATLPTNIKTCKNLDISDDVADVTLSLGSTIHMEGSSMASILKIVFLAGIFNISFTGIDNYLIAILVAILSSVVMAGIPSGGLIGEMLIVSLYGFPISAFPIIATIGLIIDAPATCINSSGDIVSALLVDKMMKKA
ncbi:MAG: dicarboxylate/amino acid:cation symporter [Bacilli bacterium]|nr:dicarboxylate/amino acid:cation symporter [Bacilli bacterium]